MKHLCLLALAALTPLAARSQTPWCRNGKLPTPPPESRALSAQQQTTEHVLAVYYVIPAGIPYEKNVHDRLIAATKDIQAWYQCATGGLTWELAFPEVVRVYEAEQSREYYRDNGDWWGSLLSEMGVRGPGIWVPGTVTALWARGAGWWAGAAPGCSGECGVALLGVECFPEFNKPEWSGGECPGGVGASAWPCTPEGAFAHELGHPLGLSHPADVPETGEFASHSIMQTHWNYPDFAPPSESPWGFLTLERQKLRTNPFLCMDINLVQTHAYCDVVNVPIAGPDPTADFQLTVQAQTVSASNNSTGASLYYWAFGDGAVSNAVHPSHTYEKAGHYLVLLRASNDYSMMARAEREANPTGSSDFSISSSPTSVTVSAGGTASYTLTLTALNGFEGTVSLTCSGVPSRASCSLSPSSLNLTGSNPQNATVNVVTAAPSTSVPIPRQSPPGGRVRVALPWLIAWLAALALCALVASHKAARRTRFALGFLALVAAYSVSCGGGNGGGGGNSGTPKGTYTLTIGATSGTLSHPLSLTLVVS